MRKLILMRHGKSSWSDASLSDFERPLKKRGIRDANTVGERLAQLKIKPDLIITSSAKRAHTTARIVAECIDYAEADIRIEPRLYGCGLRELYSILSELAVDPHSIMLFGHNPTFTSLVNVHQSAYLDNLPTSGCIGFDLGTDSWSEIENIQAIKTLELIPSRLE